MDRIETLLDRSAVHDAWRDILRQALAGMDTGYLDSLLRDDGWLPGAERLLAAFRRDRDGLRYLLIGESPYPRPESANGIAFYDAAVGCLWSDSGLSRAVNRATSLRNLVKTALVAEGYLQRDADGKIGQDAIARLDKCGLIDELGELFVNLERAGFLMLNATPVLHPLRKPALEAGYWRDFLGRLLSLTAKQAPRRLTLLLWGKIAAMIEALPASAGFDRIACEHPYNISFIDNPDMLRLFARLRLLKKQA
jgi:uracil-DNA glycosylase